MIAWLQPSALWALALIAGPIVVHLLRARRARRVEFPSVRFVKPSATAAVRVGSPADLLLLAIRTATIALAAIAVARPLVVTSARVASWNARTVRAIVVDTSASMPDGREAAELAEAALADAFEGVRIDAPDLASGIARAAGWLATAQPAKRELLVISDFQSGALTARDLEDIPAPVGLRFVRVGTLPATKSVSGLELIGSSDRPSRRYGVELSQSSTRITLSPTGAAGASPGLELLAANDANSDVDALLSAVAAAGAPAPSAEQPITVRFHGAPTVGKSGALAPWMLRTIAALAQDHGIQRSEKSAPLQAVDGSIEVARDAAGRPAVLAWSDGRRLIVDVGAEPWTYFSAAVVRAVLIARKGSVAFAEQEVRTIADADLNGWARAPGDVAPDTWRQSPASDARWCWLAALVLVGLEQWVRGRTAGRAEGSERRAAA